MIEIIRPRAPPAQEPIARSSARLYTCPMKSLHDQTLAQPPFLPASRAEMDDLGWAELDVLLVSGDAHVDHPAFAMALLGRWLVAHGFRVGVAAQPDWRRPDSVTAMGRPRLLAGVGAGAVDSMLAHRTAFNLPRSDDAYTPGGKAGARPDRATIVYVNLVKQAFPGLPVVIGGIEASLRRITHYDFWTDKLRRSILLDAKADALVYGMGELPLLAIAHRLAQGGADEPVARRLLGAPGVAVMGRIEDLPPQAEVVILPSHEEIVAQPARLMEATLALERQAHQGWRWAAQAVGGRALLVAPPARPLSTAELDMLHDLPFRRAAHPIHDQPVPGLATVATSIISHRGCGGGCSFCSLALHQGRAISSRSARSILAEAQELARLNNGRVAISDVGGPSANMWGGRCAGDRQSCARASCLTPRICPRFQVDQMAIIDLLTRLAAAPGVGHVRVASGVRFDLALQQPAYARALIERFVGGQLKLAPEHVSPGVLALMRKPGLDVFERFLRMFEQISRQAGKEQYVVPYFMSAFPGCGDAQMRELTQWLGQRHWRPQQVQCFEPTPGTVATAMFATGQDPQGRPIFVARDGAQRRRQHGLLTPRPGRRRG